MRGLIEINKMNKEKFEEIKKKALDDQIPIIMDDTLKVLDNKFKDVKLDSILEIRNSSPDILVYAFLSI